jgi:hypothetical protein
MGLLDSLLDSGLDPSTDRLVIGVLKRYEQAQLANKVSSSLLDRLTGRHAYDDENAQLDIALKRRALGLPEDSDDYEDAVNSELPLVAAGFNGALQRIPEPGFLSPKMGNRGKTLLSTSIGIGEKYVGNPGVIGRLVRAVR